MMRRRAFTLAEALLAATLMAMILGAAAAIFASYSTLVRHSGPKERNLVSGYSTMDRIRCELSGAVTVVEPDPTSMALATRVLFDKVDPALTTRLPTPLDPAALFEPKDPASFCRVEYSISSGQLWRIVTGAGSAYTSRELQLVEVSGLTAQFTSSAGVNLSLALPQLPQPLVIRSNCLVWGRP